MSEICRLCLSESNETFSLKKEFREGLPISVITMIIIPIKIQEYEDFNLPQKICSTCLETVLGAYKLRAVSLNNEQYLKSNVYEPEMNIKDEYEANSSIFIDSVIPEEDEFEASPLPKVKRARTYKPDDDDDHDDEHADENYEPQPKAKKSRWKKPSLTCQICSRIFRSQMQYDNHDCNDDQYSPGDEKYSEDMHIDLYKSSSSSKTSIAWRYMGKLLDATNRHIGSGFHYCSPCVQRKKLTKYRLSTATSTLLAHLNGVHGIGRSTEGHEIVTKEVKEKYFQRTTERKRKKYIEGVNATICPVCGKTFGNHHILNKHMRLHSGNSFHCDQCPAQFAYPENLHRHQKIHDPNHLSTYICDACGNSYAEYRSLKIHIMRVHLKIPVEKKFSCTVDGCRMKFAVPYHLKKHMLTHSDLKPHECQYCGVSYTSKGDLFKHLQRSHVGDALYNCEHCSATFRFKVQLREHYKVHYKKEPEDANINGSEGNSSQF